MAMTASRIAELTSNVAWILALLLLAFIFITAPAHAQSHPADQSYLQTAGHALSGSTTFATDIFVTNATGDPVDISILFKSVNSSAGWMILPNRIHLGSHEYKELVDPLPSFGIAGIGMLIFNPCLAGADCSSVIDQTSNPHAPRYIEHSSNYREVSISARIYSYIQGTDCSHGCTRGESYPALPWYDVASVDGAAAGLDRPFITGIRALGHWRTNINVANASEFSATEIVATLYDGLGVSRGAWSASLGPLDNRQIAAEDMFPVFRESRFNRQPPVLNPWVRFEQIAVVPTADAAAYGCANGCPGFLVQGSMIDSLCVPPQGETACTSDVMRLVAQFDQPDRSRTGEPPSHCAEHPGTCGGLAPLSLHVAVKSASTSRIADVLRFTFKGPQCSIEPIASGYLVRKPNGAPLADIGVGELAGVMEMCGAATSTKEQ
jgi:hypothetical protein